MTNQKQILRENIITIATLNLEELKEKEMQISMSTLDSKAKNILYKAIQMSREADSMYNVENCLVVTSEISEAS